MIKLTDILREVRGDEVHDFYKKELSSYKSKGKIKDILYHGTNVNPDKFEFSNDFDYEEYEGNYARDYDIPYGVVFLTTDFREASAHGRYVLPCFLEAKDILTFKVNSNNPSNAFDEDYNYVGKIYPKFEEGMHEALEIRGYDKSTIITYPELVTVRGDLAKKIYGA